MSSDLYSFGTSFHAHDGGVGDLPFLSDPFPIFTNSENSNSNITLPSSSSPVDPFSTSFFSFSPPSSHLESLSLYQHHATSNSVQNMGNEFGSFSGFDEVKSEECQMGGVDYMYGQQLLLPHSYSGAENFSKYMQLQRSFSSKSFEGKPGFLSQPHCDTLVDSPKFHRNDLSSPEDNSVFGGQMRRVCSTGDLQNMNANHMSPTEAPLLEESNFKVGRYSAEERKERISKYRAKRNQRNFNKTIKYACRKTLADNRPRIRGRFARNDETNEIPKPSCSTRDEDEVDFWIEELRLHEELDDVTVGAQQYDKSYGVSIVGFEF